MRVLLDTNVVAYRIMDDKRFRAGIGKVFAELKKKKATLLVCAVTVQELEVVARYNKTLDKYRLYMDAMFPQPLSLDKLAAQTAARLAASVTRATGSTKSERKTITDRWHRDASIAGIAVQHGLDGLVTANVRDFRAFEEHMGDCALIPVEPDGS